jgi:hypothetical protein
MKFWYCYILLEFSLWNMVRVHIQTVGFPCNKLQILQQILRPMAIALPAVVGLLHIPWRTILLGKVTGSQLVKKFPALYGTRGFINAFTSVGHLYPFWNSSIQSIPPTSHFLTIHLNIILIYAWVFQVVLTLRFPHQNTVCNFPIPKSATNPGHLILFDLITQKIFGEEYFQQ